MNKFMKLAAFAAASATLLVACNKEKDVPAPIVPTDGSVMRVTIPDALTKVSLTDQTAADAGMVLAWEAGDAIRVISGSSSEQFSIKEGFSGHVAEFEGSAVSGSSFDVIYPGTIASLEAALSYDYAGQTQTGNGSTAHLKYNAALVGVDTYEQVAFIPDWATEHGGTLYQNGVLKLVVTLPEDVTTVTKAALVAESELFVTDNAGVKKSDELSVALENVDVSADGGVLTAYLNIPAREQAIAAGTALTVKVTGADGTEYAKSFEVPSAVTLQGGKLNTVRLTAEGPEILSDYFVSVAGAGDKTGADWENAMGRDELVTLLSSGDANALQGVSIHMAAGEYNIAETLDGNYLEVSFSDVAEVVALTVNGGYPATLTGTDIATRDTTQYRTIFTGNKETGILAIGDNVDIQLEGLTFQDVLTDTDTYGALSIDGSSTSVSVKSCRFVNNSNSDSGKSGASVILDAGALTMENCYFAGNLARNAGALLLRSGDGPVSVSNCLFFNNRGINTSGAAQNSGIKNVTFTDCVFDSNKAYDESVNSWGGGAFHTGGSAETSFVGCTFKDNIAKRCGGAISLEGATVTCTDCTFTGNRADQGDKSLAGQGQNKTAVTGNVGGGAIILRKEADVLTLNNCTFEGNTAPNGNGGAIGTQDAGAKLIINAGTIFKDNIAYMHGGAIFAWNNLTIEGTAANKVTFSGNYTIDTGSGVSNGGAIYLNSNTSSTINYAVFANNDAGTESGSDVNYSNGGAISMRSVTSFLMDQCEFFGNRGRNGGCLNMELGSSSVCKITNCNFHDNIGRSGANKDGTSGNFSGAVARLGGGTVEFEKCVFKNNVVNNASAVLHMNVDNVVARFTDCVLSGNECRGNNVCIKLEKAGEKLYMNRCLFEGNHGNTRGMINPASSTLVYLNDVTFKDNYTTGGNGWGVNIHASNANICMNNVTSYNNYCSNASPGNCVAFNSDGGWLVVNSTILDKTPLALIRGKSRQITICNDILVNNTTAGNVLHLQTTGKLNDYGHNVVSGTAAPSASDAWASTDLQGVAESGLGTLSYTSNWTASPYYGVYSWSGSLTGFSAATQADVEGAMTAGYTENDSAVALGNGGSDIGKDFYNWLNSIGALGKDGRGVARTAPWWPGAYQN